MLFHHFLLTVKPSVKHLFYLLSVDGQVKEFPIDGLNIEFVHFERLVRVSGFILILQDNSFVLSISAYAFLIVRYELGI